MHLLWSALVFFRTDKKLREFKYIQVQFKDKLDMLFIGNSATDENKWVPTDHDPMRVPSDDVDHESQTMFIPGQHDKWTEVSKKEKIKESCGKDTAAPKNITKGEISKYVE